MVAQAKRREKKYYTTKEVADALSIPQWRVKNFTEGDAYRLPPALRVGSGRGSRRLYRWTDIYRMLIANELVDAGFTPEVVGRAILEIPESKLRPPDPFPKNPFVLVHANHKWEVMPLKSVNLTTYNLTTIVQFQQLIEDLHHDLQEKETQEYLAEHYPDWNWIPIFRR